MLAPLGLAGQARAYVQGLDAQGYVREVLANDGNPALKVRQDGTGDLLQTLDGAAQVFRILDGGNVELRALLRWWNNALGTGEYAQMGYASNELAITQAQNGGVLRNLNIGTGAEMWWLGVPGRHYDTIPYNDALRDLGLASARWRDIHLSGDIQSLPGGQLIAYQFSLSAPATGQTNVALTVPGTTANITGCVPVRAGSVIGVRVRRFGGAAPTTGSLTVEPTVSGTGTGLTAAINATNGTQNGATQAKDADIFAAGDAVGCRYTTTADWNGTGDYLIEVLVEY